MKKIFNCFCPKNSWTKIFVIFASLSFLIRTIFFVWENKSIEFSAIIIAKTYSLGLFFDFLTIGYIAFIPLLYYALIPNKIFNHKIHQNANKVFYFLFLFAIIFSCFSEVVFWEEFQVRFNFIAVDYHAMIREAHKKVFTTKKIVTYETEALDKDGSKIWFQTYVGPMLIGNEVVGLTVFTRDISERIESEEKIKKSLKEKEILLQEVHHRVKNNLQIISSILNLQTRSIKNPKFLDLIQETRYRIMSMSFIHDLLYQTTDFTNIDFSKYLQSITSNIMNTYTLNKNIDLKLDVESIFLNLDNAIPCGLIVNELITNVFKYAFPDDRKGEINIALKQINNKVVLSVADNGVGIKKQVDYKTTESLGFQLINSLVNQIDGDLAYENNNGTKFTVSFDAIKAINS
jgi:two-component sensor histidine kinase